MQDLDKEAMGKRIRQIRLAAGLRQWELARMLGTTQSAVHKYEHGVVPEPRRLVELARIGQTSIEWVLTGRHWENGSRARERLEPDLLRTASLLRELTDDERESLDEALEILREAAQALSPVDDGNGGVGTSGLAALIGPQTDQTLRLLESAWRIQASVLKRVTEAAARRLNETPNALPAD